MQPSQTPKSMIEILKFTYDFDYAREQSMKAAKELYPELNQEGLIPIAQMLGNGMQLNEQMAQLTEIVLSAAGANKGTTMPRPTTPLATRFETLFKAKKAMEMENEYNDMIARHAPHLLK